MKTYAVKVEISGPSAMWTRPDTGDAPVSYPAPTFSAAKGIFESILWIPAVTVVPERVEVCSPIVFHSYQTNYNGPLRKAESIKKGNPYQLLATILVNPCYRLYARVERSAARGIRFAQQYRDWERKTTSPEHAFQEIFERRMRRGQSFTIPFLGWREFAPDYVGPFRSETEVAKDINLTIPSMLRAVFPDGVDSQLRFVFDVDVPIRNGVLVYGDHGHVG